MLVFDGVCLYGFCGDCCGNRRGVPLWSAAFFAVTGGTYPLRDSPAGHGPQFISYDIFDGVW